MDHIVPLEETKVKEQLAYLNAGGEPQADEPDGQQGMSGFSYPLTAAQKRSKWEKQQHIEDNLIQQLPISMAKHFHPRPKRQQFRRALMGAFSGK